MNAHEADSLPPEAAAAEASAPESAVVDKPKRKRAPRKVAAGAVALFPVGCRGEIGVIHFGAPVLSVARLRPLDEEKANRPSRKGGRIGFWRAPVYVHVCTQTHRSRA